MEKQKNLKTLLIGSECFLRYFYIFLGFCDVALNDLKYKNKRDVSQTIENMSTKYWWKTPASLLYKIYKNKSINSICLVYNGRQIIGLAGTEELDKDTLIIAKRFFILKKYRLDFIFSNYILEKQIEWAKEHGYKKCILTFNAYNDKLAIGFERATKGKGWGTKHSPIIQKFEYEGIKNICNVYQKVFSYTIGDNNGT